MSPGPIPHCFWFPPNNWKLLSKLQLRFSHSDEQKSQQQKKPPFSSPVGPLSSLLPPGFTPRPSTGSPLAKSPGMPQPQIQQTLPFPLICFSEHLTPACGFTLTSPPRGPEPPACSSGLLRPFLTLSVISFFPLPRGS